MVERFHRGHDSTGGTFSQGYVVSSAQGERLFLKALDFSRAIGSEDPTRAIEAMTSAFNYERDLLIQCRDRRMDRVVLAVADGTLLVDESNPFSIVPYIVFELGDGDVRDYIDLSESFDLRWALRALHHVATGLHQLHCEQIAHQDLKPSNVMMFAQGRHAKLGDLGRASTLAKTGLFDTLPIPGDTTYAAPELLYGAPPSDWMVRRFGSDAYQLGSMIVFLFVGLSMTALWVQELPMDQRPMRWQGTFDDVLPYMRDAFGRALERIANCVPSDVRDPLTTMVRHLCDPDPSLRGHPRNRAMKHGNPLSLERFVSELDLLARRTEHGLRIKRAT